MTAPRSDDEAVLEAAARWLELARTGMSATDRAAFRHWLEACPEHTAAADMVARAWAAAPAAAAQGGFVASPTRERAAPRARSLRPIAWGGGMAGAALAAVALFWFGQPVTTHYATGASERRMVALADGSQAWLAPGTRLTARIGWWSRSSTIDTGEAVFDVVHQWRGFAVEAGPITVVDRGTLFAVRLRDRAPRVTLARGAVSIQDRNTGAVLAEPDPGQAVDVVQGRAVTRTVDAEGALSWREGRLTFADTPLRDAVAAFREQGYTLRLADPDLGGLRISGAYAIADIESFLSALSSIHPVRWTRAADGYTIARR